MSILNKAIKQTLNKYEDTSNDLCDIVTHMFLNPVKKPERKKDTKEWRESVIDRINMISGGL